MSGILLIDGENFKGKVRAIFKPNKGTSFSTERTILIRNAEALEFANIQKTLLGASDTLVKKKEK